MWNKPKVILLASNQEVNSLYGYKDKSLLFGYNKEGYNKLEAEKEFTQHYHLYIINNDVIKEGDWCYINFMNKELLVRQNVHGEIGSVIGSAEYLKNNYKKIIATTDNELGFGDEFGYFEHLPQIPQSFIEQYITEYNKGNIINDILVEYEGIEWLDKPLEYFPKINQDNIINIKTVKDSFSRDELEQHLFNLAEHYGMTSTKSEIDDFNNWIHQNL